MRVSYALSNGPSLLESWLECVRVLAMHCLMAPLSPRVLVGVCVRVSYALSNGPSLLESWLECVCVC